MANGCQYRNLCVEALKNFSIEEIMNDDMKSKIHFSSNYCQNFGPCSNNGRNGNCPAKNIYEGFVKKFERIGIPSKIGLMTMAIKNI
ncbi:MAG: hypothetical protein JW700_00780 [Candidatus Aenigmarchaeota archaeon]|nr:hypothetical protein [Candidatus Aenigmarchaeota archaeon]